MLKNLFCVVVAFFVGLGWVHQAGAMSLVGAEGGMVVANRADGSISVIDVATQMVTPVAMPAGAVPSEPMYVTYNPENHAVLVGDRANNRVVIFDAKNFSSLGEVATGNGVFHMSADQTIGQVWVNNDVDKSVTVINSQTLTPITTINLPADLINDGGIPHEVVLDPSGPFAYITMIGLGTGGSQVLKYSTDTFTLVDQEVVDGAAHLALSDGHDRLYVLNQGTDEVQVRSRATLDLLDTIDAPNPHGESHLADGSILYATNISDGGIDGLLTIDTSSDTVVDTDDTPMLPTPHNIALSPGNGYLYITHSGATADKVSVFDLSNPADPSFLTSLTAGLNPFGIGAVPAAPVPEPVTAGLGLMGLGVLGAATRRRRMA